MQRLVDLEMPIVAAANGRASTGPAISPRRIRNRHRPCPAGHALSREKTMAPHMSGPDPAEEARDTLGGPDPGGFEDELGGRTPEGAADTRAALIRAASRTSWAAPIRAARKTICAAAPRTMRRTRWAARSGRLGRRSRRPVLAKALIEGIGTSQARRSVHVPRPRSGTAPGAGDASSRFRHRVQRRPRRAAVQPARGRRADPLARRDHRVYLGTTGLAEGCEISHGNLTEAVRAIRARPGSGNAC